MNVHPIRTEWIDEVVAKLEGAGSAPVVGLFGALGHADVGDEAMLIAIQGELEERLPGVRFVVFSNDPGRTEPYIGQKCFPSAEAIGRRGRRGFRLYKLLVFLERATSRLLRRLGVDEIHLDGRIERRVFRRQMVRLRRMATGGAEPRDDLDVAFRDAIQDIDALVMIGGAYLNSWHVKAALLYYMAMLEIGLAREIPVIASGLNLGPFNKSDLRRVGSTLSKLDLVGLRDWKESLGEIDRSPALDRELFRYSCDDAVSLGAMPLPRPVEDSIGEFSRYIVVHVHRWRLGEAEFEFVLDSLREAIVRVGRDHDVGFVFVPMSFSVAGDEVRSSDHRLAVQLSESVGDDVGCYVVPDDLDPRMLRSIYEGACASVVTRHHGMVFSMVSDCPCVALSFDRYYTMKMRGVTDRLGGDVEVIELGELSETPLDVALRGMMQRGPVPA